MSNNFTSPRSQGRISYLSKSTVRLAPEIPTLSYHSPPSSPAWRQMLASVPPYFVQTPTGVATFNIVGKTLHALFYLRMKLAGEYISLPTSTLKGFRRSSTIFPI
ncbi:hypothetical protein N7461_009046 [Penicillium sp. DV-2018c]|nr:hypothetical protein N7461_009046 [Penicillium sp. DV-2018c]